MIFWLYPAALIHASEGQNTALVFEVKPNQNQNYGVTYEELAQNSVLVQNLTAYLSKKQPGSPLIAIAPKIIKYTNWKRAIAISFVESNMCLRTPTIWVDGEAIESHNCSGIAGGRRIYSNYEEWFADMDKLLSQPNYINRPLHKFIGYYVVPGSYAWLNGSRNIEAGLTQLEQDANNARLTQADSTAINASIFNVELALK